MGRIVFQRYPSDSEVSMTSALAGDADIWLSTRSSAHGAWSPPLNLGSVINTEFAEERPNLSHDVGPCFSTLFGRAVWMTARTSGCPFARRAARRCHEHDAANASRVSALGVDRVWDGAAASH